MKKLIIILAVAFVTLAFTSCRKDWTCVCTDNGVTVEFPLTNLTKPEAKTSCNLLETGTIDVECSLK